ncbi:hypothetical protein C7382_10259 [Porphyromonas loveana]|uniref:Uncharacterized protein n=1 Tax=Porphyromonas loveana TaxID=1884669 RepID=A0A2U1FPB4_9PORP|nr:hypothetical protein C7382_10259 [Porphyromonas loveana]
MILVLTISSLEGVTEPFFVKTLAPLYCFGVQSAAETYLSSV